MNKSVYKINYFLPIVSAIVCSLMQIVELPLLALFCLVPLFWALECGNNKKQALRIYFIVYHMILNSYLLTLYDTLPINRFAGMLLCILCIWLLSVYQSVVMLACTIPIITIKSPQILLIAFCFCYPFGQFLLERIPAIGYPWARLELSLTPIPEFLSSSRIFGGNFTALIILVVNLLVYYVIKACKEGNIGKTAMFSTVATIVIFSSYMYGRLNIARNSSGNYIRILIIQSDVEGVDKLSVTKKQAVEWYCNYITNVSSEKYNLILLPETAIPAVLDDQSENKLIECVGKNTSIVCGCILSKDEKRYNAIKVLGTESVHLKEILVPFGEYIPFCEIDGMPKLKASKNDTAILVDDTACAALICIESIYSHLLLKQIRNDAQIVFVSTNDSWFKDSFARQMHFRHSVLRACEYDRYVVRSANCGISALIDRYGNVQAAINSKEAVCLDVSAELLTTKTIYARFGELPMIIPLVLLVWLYLRIISQKLYRMNMK